MYLEKAEQKPAIALLLLLLRDFYQERIPLGYGVNRGMGSIKVTKIEISGQGLLELGTVNFDHFTMTDKAFQGVDSVFLQQLQAAWQDWISKARMPQEVIYA